MFRKTDTNPQFDLFTAPGNILPKRAQKKYTDEKAWHNQFFKLVTSQIGEDSFRPLFEQTKMGAPNASIRILVAMSILKEGLRPIAQYPIGYRGNLFIRSFPNEVVHDFFARKWHELLTMLLIMCNFALEFGEKE